MRRFLQEVSNLKGLLRVVFRCCQTSILHKRAQLKLAPTETLSAPTENQQSITGQGFPDITTTMIHPMVDLNIRNEIPHDLKDPFLYCKIDPTCSVASEFLHSVMMKYLSATPLGGFLGWGTTHSQVSNCTAADAEIMITEWQNKYDLPANLCQSLKDIVGYSTCAQRWAGQFGLSSDGVLIMASIATTAGKNPGKTLGELINQFAATGVHTIMLHNKDGLTHLHFALPVRFCQPAPKGLKAIFFANTPHLQDEMPHVPTAISA